MHFHLLHPETKISTLNIAPYFQLLCPSLTTKLLRYLIKAIYDNRYYFLITFKIMNYDFINVIHALKSNDTNSLIILIIKTQTAS